MSTLYYNDEDLPGFVQQKILAKFVGTDLVKQKITSKSNSLALYDNGVLLNDANAISIQLGFGSVLLGKNFAEEIEIYSWLEFFNIEVLPLVQQIDGQISGVIQFNEVKYNYSVQELKKVLKTLDDSLKLKSFFVSNNVTLADIVLCLNLNKTYQFVLVPELRKKFMNLSRWFSFVRNQIPFIQILGLAILCQTVFVPSQNVCKKEQQQKEFKDKENDNKYEAMNPIVQKPAQMNQIKVNVEQKKDTGITQVKETVGQQTSNEVLKQ